MFRKALVLLILATAVYLVGCTAVAMESLAGDKATEESQPVAQPETGNSITGTYTSVTSGPTRFLVRKPNPEITLVQKANEITGSYGSLNGAPGGQIYGSIEGDRIKFRYEYPGLYGTGEWIIKPGSNEIEGKWSSLATQGGGGKWNLTRIDDTGEATLRQEQNTQTRNNAGGNNTSGNLGQALAQFILYVILISGAWVTMFL